MFGIVGINAYSARSDCIGLASRFTAACDTNLCDGECNKRAKQFYKTCKANGTYGRAAQKVGSTMVDIGCAPDAESSLLMKVEAIAGVAALHSARV